MEKTKRVVYVNISTGMALLGNARSMRLYEDTSWHRDPEDVKRAKEAYTTNQRSRYAPHRKYGFVKNLKK